MNGEMRYASVFARLARRNEGAFVPFTVLGDPDAATSLELVRTLARSGADALELGIAFSDPVADGPTIQAASRRALDAGVRVKDCWPIVATTREEFPDLPIGLLVYANLVLHAGAERFYARAARAGVDSVLVADVPLLEFAALERAATEHEIAPVLIASPNVPDDRLGAIAARSRGYVYVTSRSGVTGAEQSDLRQDAASVLLRLRRIGSSTDVAPRLLGFGIGNPEQVRVGLALGASGVISGSAVAARIERHAGGAGQREVRKAMLADIADFVGSMKQATVDSGAPTQL